MLLSIRRIVRLWEDVITQGSDRAQRWLKGKMSA